MKIPQWMADDIPSDKPSPARMYDYYLGGFHNFDIDRQAAESVIAIYPDAPLVAQTNRAFLRRAVKFLCDQGIDQFLDIGSGIPTVGNVHEMVGGINPAACVVYVDVEPVAVRHSELLLEDLPNASAIQADVRQPESIIDHPEVQRLLDFQKPLAILLVAVLPFVPDNQEAYAAVNTLRDMLSSDSYLAITHGTNERMPTDVRAQIEQLYSRTTNPVTFRSQAETVAFFEGLLLVEPGLVYVPRWRPEEDDDLFLDEPERSINFAGVGRKP